MRVTLRRAVFGEKNMRYVSTMATLLVSKGATPKI
jgi:hypothetical protein